MSAMGGKQTFDGTKLGSVLLDIEPDHAIDRQIFCRDLVLLELGLSREPLAALVRTFYLSPLPHHQLQSRF